MRVVSHDDIASHGPTVTGASGGPLFNEDFCNQLAGKNRASLFRTGRYEIDGLVDPDPGQALEVLVRIHIRFVAGIGDPGNY